MLRVMSLNIGYYGTRHGTWPVRRELIAQVIRAAMPDIVALQAVRQDAEKDHGVNQATQLANLVPNFRHVYFQPAVRTPDGGAEGSAILSRLTMTDTQYLPLTLLPDVEDANHRVLLMACFDLRYAPFYLFNGHFSSGAAQAESSVSEALPFVESHKGPALFVGDLNQTPDSPAMKRLAQSDWTDIWAMLRPAEPGFTFEAGNPDKRIDYAWSSFEMTPLVNGIEIVGTDRGPSGAEVSDHLGLLVSLDLNPR